MNVEKIYFDMDGVLADFECGVREICGVIPPDQNAKDIKVNIVFREEKPQYCTGPGCILIDDMQRNIRDWNAMGGTGIVHVSAEETIEKLKEMGVI